MTSPDTVLFDRDCPLCRSLAAFAAGRSGTELRFVAWQEFRESTEAMALGTRDLAPDRLRVLAGGRLLEGEGAWSYLLESHQDLAALNWLAAKLGLTRAVASVMDRSGGLVRRLCLRCGR